MRDLEDKVFARHAIIHAEVCWSCLREGIPRVAGHRGCKCYIDWALRVEDDLNLRILASNS
jgi:hypothetical protein